MWGLMAAISAAILAPDVVRRARIPEYPSIAYYHHVHPGMTDLQIAELRSAMGEKLTPGEIEMLSKKYNEKINKDMGRLTDEQYVSKLTPFYGMGDYKVYYTNSGNTPYILIVYDPIHKRIVNNGIRKEFDIEGAMNYFKSLDSVYLTN